MLWRDGAGCEFEPDDLPDVPRLPDELDDPESDVSALERGDGWGDAMEPEEEFDLVDETGRVVGRATRAAVHGDPSLLHPVVHCIITNGHGEMLLQKRAADKDVQPDRWDTAMGGHVDAGESIETALARELGEELGLDAAALAPTPLYRYIMRNDIESELVHTFHAIWDGPFRAQASEISALRFWTEAEIAAALGTGAFTPNFEDEYRRFRAHGDPGRGRDGDPGGDPGGDAGGGSEADRAWRGRA